MKSLQPLWQISRVFACSTLLSSFLALSPQASCAAPKAEPGKTTTAKPTATPTSKTTTLKQNGVPSKTSAAKLNDAPSKTGRAQAIGYRRQQALQIVDEQFSVFKELCKKTPAENVCFSPLCLDATLRTLRDGATGDTFLQLQKLAGTSVLNLPAAPPRLGKPADKPAKPGTKGSGAPFPPPSQAPQPTETSTTFPRENPDRGPVQIDMCSSLWAKPTFQFRKEFTDKEKAKWGTECFTIDEDLSKTLSRINTWVSDATHGKIDSALDSLNPNVGFMAVNTLYFKGYWSTIFQDSSTGERSFKLTSGAVKLVQTMNKTDYLKVFETPIMQAICLPYENNQESSLTKISGELVYYDASRFAAYVIVPKPGHSLSEVRQQLSKQHLNQWVKKFQLREVLLFLPKFDGEFFCSLKQPLMKLGMTQAFQPSAKFSKMFDSKQKPYLFEIDQRVKLTIWEEGTEASAVTYGRGGGGSWDTMHEPPPPPMLFSADKPFLFIIRDDQTGNVLFSSQIADADPTVKTSREAVRMRMEEAKVERARWAAYRKELAEYRKWKAAQDKINTGKKQH